MLQLNVLVNSNRNCTGAETLARFLGSLAIPRIEEDPKHRLACI